MHANAAFGHRNHCALFERKACLLDHSSDQGSNVRAAQAFQRIRITDGERAPLTAKWL